MLPSSLVGDGVLSAESCVNLSADGNVPQTPSEEHTALPDPL